MAGPAPTHPPELQKSKQESAYLISLLALVGRLTGAERIALVRDRHGSTSVWLAVARDGSPIDPVEIRLPKGMVLEKMTAPEAKDGGLVCPILADGKSGGAEIGVYLEKRPKKRFSARDLEIASMFTRSFTVALSQPPVEAPPQRSLPESLNDEVLLARTTDTPLSLVLVRLANLDDLDSGEGIEELQASIRETLRKTLRTFDRVEDWGKGEFLVTVPHTASSEALNVARKIEGSLRTRPGPVRAEVRLGILGFPDDANDPEELMGKMESLWKKLADPAAPPIITGPPDRKKAPSSEEPAIFTGDIATDHRNVQMLLETIAAVTSPVEMDILYEMVLDMLIEMTGADRGVLMLLGEDGELEQASARIAGQAPPKSEVMLSTSTIERVLQSGEAIFVPDVLTEKNRRLISDSVQQLNLRFILCAPLRVKEKTSGIVYLDSQIENQTFYRTDLTFFEAIVKQVAIAIENAHLLEEMRQKEEEERMALAEENIRLRQRLEPRRSIVGECPQMNEVFNNLRKVARNDVTVLVYGESGTGKEAIASSIHELGARKARPFQIIDCGAIPENLLESELFGYRKGAFTGAYESRKGKFELAHGGTIFLDEISNIPLSLQGKLLRVLQEKEIEPVGGGRRRKVDVRIIAATNRRLEELVEEKSFRGDLYYRLNVVTLEIPPLRERGDDIILLANYFLARFAKEQGKEIRGFSKAAKIALKEHDWPGNVREMEHRVQRATIMTEEHYITPQDLELVGSPKRRPSLREVREGAERRYVWDVLDRTGGNVTLAAKEMGVSRGTLYDLLKKYKIRGASED